MRKNKLNNTMYEIKSTEIPLWFLHHMRQPVPAQQFHSFPLALCLCATIQHQKNHAIQIRVIPVLPGDLVCTEFNSHFKQSTAHLFRLRAVCSKGNRNATKSPRYTSTAQSHILIVFFGVGRPWVARWCAQQSTEAAGSAIPCLQSTHRLARDQLLVYLFKLIALRIH